MIRAETIQASDPRQLIDIGGRTFVVLAEGGLYDKAEAALIIADLHLEKGSSMARRGFLVPPYDSSATLSLLAIMIERVQPKRVICLGDSFHDSEGAARLGGEELSQLFSLQAGRDWLWVSGNHDPRPPEGVGGSWRSEARLGEVVLTHEPKEGFSGAEIAGHLHPVARLRTVAGSIRRRCLASDGRRAILPALGAFTGGLELAHRAFDGLFDEQRLVAYLLDKDRVVPLAAQRSRRLRALLPAQAQG